MLHKEKRRIKRHGRIRKKMLGTPQRPRLSVHRSAKNLYIQIVDDLSSKTLFSFSTLDKRFEQQKPKAGKVDASRQLGKFFAGLMKEKGIVKVAFDRGGYQYHGRIKALADALREGGIQF